MNINDLILEKARVYELFPSPLLEFFWHDSQQLNKDLIQIILEKEGQSKGIETTNVGGWHSKKDFQEWEGDCIKVLISRMQAMGREMIRRFICVEEKELLSGWTTQAWANINRYGHYNKFHTHIRNLNLWSGVYYVDDGLADCDSSSTAKIIFADQHRVEAKDRDELKQRFSMQPVPGLMLLFPSGLGHRVEAHTGHRGRITVAFNLRHDSFTTIAYEIEKNKNKSKNLN